MVTASFRLYEELNDFLAPKRRKQEFTVPCALRRPKTSSRRSGGPHTEVELILMNGESADFNRLLEDRGRVQVYPRFGAMDMTPLLRVRDQPVREPCFVRCPDHHSLPHQYAGLSNAFTHEQRPGIGSIDSSVRDCPSHPAGCESSSGALIRSCESGWNPTLE